MSHADLAPLAPAADADPFLDFPDDSGATEHVVEPIAEDAPEGQSAHVAAAHTPDTH